MADGSLELGVEVDASDVLKELKKISAALDKLGMDGRDAGDQAAQGLDEVADSAHKTEKAVDDVGKSTDKTGGLFSNMKASGLAAWGSVAAGAAAVIKVLDQIIDRQEKIRDWQIEQEDRVSRQRSLAEFTDVTQNQAQALTTALGDENVSALTGFMGPLFELASRRQLGVLGEGDAERVRLLSSLGFDFDRLSEEGVGRIGHVVSTLGRLPSSARGTLISEGISEQDVIDLQGEFQDILSIAASRVSPTFLEQPGLSLQEKDIRLFASFLSAIDAALPSPIDARRAQASAIVARIQQAHADIPSDRLAGLRPTVEGRGLARRFGQLWYEGSTYVSADQATRLAGEFTAAGQGGALNPYTNFDRRPTNYVVQNMTITQPGDSPKVEEDSDLGLTTISVTGG